MPDVSLLTIRGSVETMADTTLYKKFVQSDASLMARFHQWTLPNPHNLPRDYDVFTTSEVAAYLRVTQRTILQWARRRRIPKRFGQWRFTKEDISRMTGRAEL